MKMKMKTGSVEPHDRNILLVIDSLDSDWAANVRNEKDDAVRYHLLSIGFSPEQAFLRYGASSTELRKKVSIVDTKKISPLAEEEARTYYLNLIRELPRKKTSSGASMSEILSCQGRNLWWYLDICEKNIWTDRLIHRLYALFRFIYTCRSRQYDDIRLFIDDNLLRDAFIEYAENQGISRVVNRTARKRFDFFSRQRGRSVHFTASYLFRIVREFIKLCLKMIIMRLTGVKAEQDVIPQSVGLFSVYPQWWKNAFSEDAEEIIFSSAPEELAKKERLQWVLWLIPGRALFGRKDGFASYLKNRRVIIPERLLGLFDLFALFDPRLFLRLLKVLRLTNQISFCAEGGDASGFVRAEMFRSLVSPMFFQALLLGRALSRLNFSNFKAFLFRLEFQPLERAILYNASGKTRTVGFQHSALGKNFLNYVFTDGELGEHWSRKNDTESMPLPDYIVTSGERGALYMHNAGYPDERTAVSGAVRFSSLLEYVKTMPDKTSLRNRYGVPRDKKVIFVATSPLLHETLCMINDLLGAVGSDGQACHVMIKCHPNVAMNEDFMGPLHDILDTYQGETGIEVLATQVPLHDYISLSDAIVLTGGTIALEAMLLGCVSIIYTSEAQFSHNPMVEYPDAVLLVSDRESMQRALKMMSRPETLENLKRSWKRPIQDAFDDVAGDPNTRFISVLTEKFHVL